MALTKFCTITYTKSDFFIGFYGIRVKKTGHFSTFVISAMRLVSSMVVHVSF